MRLLFILTLFSISACAQMTKQRTATFTLSEIADLEKLVPLPSDRPVQIETKFFDRNETLATPTVIARNGQTAAVEIIADVDYPTRFTLARPNPSTGSAIPGAVEPARSVAHKTAPTGLSLKVTPQIRGAFIELSGSVIFSWSEGHTAHAAAGEGIGRVTSDNGSITLAENPHLLPVFGTRTTPFFIRALPGRTYTLTVQGERDPVRIDITPTLRAPVQSELAQCDTVRPGDSVAWTETPNRAAPPFAAARPRRTISAERCG